MGVFRGGLFYLCEGIASDVFDRLFDCLFDCLFACVNICWSVRAPMRATRRLTGPHPSSTKTQQNRTPCGSSKAPARHQASKLAGGSNMQADKPTDRRRPAPVFFVEEKQVWGARHTSCEETAKPQYISIPVFKTKKKKTKTKKKRKPPFFALLSTLLAFAELLLSVALP